MLNRLKTWFGIDPESNHNEPSSRIAELGKVLGYEIPAEHEVLFKRALRHRSIVDNNKYESFETYERLEFLGDAVLDLIITEILFEIYPKENEGYLTKLRAKIVRGDTLCELSKNLQLNEYLEVGERASGQGIELSKSVLSDVFEALVAAIYISGGYRSAFEFVRRTVESYLDFGEVVNHIDNHKSILMEFSQAEKWDLPTYKVISETGPGHNKTFTIAAFVNGKRLGEGRGKTKKKAEQKAAKDALQNLGIKE
ncbi:MAG TPA: ribonuclease III [Balneolaceae bacterium]|nr:ribonuclease III [Balneolaceae bacterium]